MKDVSSLMIVPVAVDVVIAVPMAFVRRTSKVSATSTSVSPEMSIVMTCEACPAANVIVPFGKRPLKSSVVAAFVPLPETT